MDAVIEPERLAQISLGQENPELTAKLATLQTLALRQLQAASETLGRLQEIPARPIGKHWQTLLRWWNAEPVACGIGSAVVRSMTSSANRGGGPFF